MRGQWSISPSFITCCALLLRYMVSLWPYSGQAVLPMHGDYEAQRHWMEITTALPVGLWYRFNLGYWGLDYPPLTAYVSWACGMISTLVEPASMVLGLSRGYETGTHKVFMRLTVLLLDLAVFFPAAAALSSRLAHRTPSVSAGSNNTQARVNKFSMPSAASVPFLMTLLQPSLVLIDHGHFQYNAVCLGLAMAGAAAVASGAHRGEIAGSVLFSLSLNFKQMALYYSPAFFFFLLASSMWGMEGGRTLGVKFVSQIRAFKAQLRARINGRSSRVRFRVLLRLFPFSRGLFEDKVANVWFSLDVVLKLRRKLAVSHLAKLALLSTLISLLVFKEAGLDRSLTSLLVPSGVELLRPGRPLTVRRLVLALFNSSLAFFLCSFQVHEKSLLLALCPLAFLWEDAPLFVTWLQVVGVFSMKPLLGREGLLVPCLVCTILYVAASAVFASSCQAADGASAARREESLLFPCGRLITSGLFRVVVASSFAGMLVLLALEGLIPPPEALPHLHPTLNALFSCAYLAVAYVLGICWQWKLGDASVNLLKNVEAKKQP